MLLVAVLGTSAMVHAFPTASKSSSLQKKLKQLPAKEVKANKTPKKQS